MLLQDHIDYLFEIKLTRFSILTPTDNLFFLDPNIEHDLSQLQTNYHLKLTEINQIIERLTEKKVKAERLKLIIQSIEENLNAQESHLQKITHQRQLDEQSTFDNLAEFFPQIEQIQIQFKESSKNLNQIANDVSTESLKAKLESLRSIANDEYIHLNRLNNEYKSLNQMIANYNELNEQINECIVNILQYADNRSRMITPELEQRAPVDQLVQLNIYQIQIQEQLNMVEHHGSTTSNYIKGRIEQLREDILSLKEEIESILDKENETASMQMKIDRLMETLQNEFDRQPTFSSILTTDTFESYERLSKNYLQAMHQLETELETAIEQFQDEGLLRQYNSRFDSIKERFQSIERNSNEQIEHLRQGLNEQNLLQKQIHTIVEDLNDCENQLKNRQMMKEYQVEQKLQVRGKERGELNAFLFLS